jgi:hypothetical protein
MCKPSLKLPALLAFVTMLFIGMPSIAQVDVPANLRVSGPVDYPGGGLKGEYWKRPPVSILTDGRANRTNGIDNQIRTFGTADGTFKATRFVYLGNDLTLVKDWLSSDGASFVGTTNNNDDGAYRFTGFINVKAAGVVNMGLTSDDGSRITIGGLDIAERDGSHGDETQDVDVNFASAGLYPIEITFFNGDWTSDGNNHSGNPDPGVHGGANFHLRMSGADITPAGVAMLYPPSAAPRPPVAVGLNFGADDNAAALGLAATDVAGAVAQANWNNLNGASSAAPVANLTADSNGVAVATTISVEWTSPNTWSSTGRGEENNGFPPGADRTMMTGYIDTGNTDGTKATVTVSGIPTDFTSGGYDVLVYCLGGVAARGGAYTIGGQTKFGTAPASPTAHVEDPGVDLADTGTYVRFRGLYTSSFTLLASADPALGATTVNFRAPINGIQIVKNQDPQAGLARGYILKQRYDALGNSLDVEALLTSEKYTNNQPDSTCLRADFSANDANECNDCGFSVRGFFIPKTSGPHVFYISADDRAALFLSTDETPAHKVQIAREPEWAGRRRYIDNTGSNGGGGRGDPPANRSLPIDLAAGSLYYIEGAVKEAGGGDNLDVAVQGPGDPEVMDLDPPIFGDRIATFADLTGSSLAITQNPASIRVPEGDVAAFTVAADATSPLCGGAVTYQWQRKSSGATDFTDISGATSASYSFGPVRAEDHLAVFQAIVRIPGIARTSSAATLEVLGRECLRVVGATASGDLTHATVQFSTFINTNLPSAVDTFNYTVTGPGGTLAVTAVTVGGDTRSVTLTTDPMAENTQYTVAVQNVESIVGSPTCMAPTNTATFRTGVTDPCGGVLFEAYNTGAGNAVSVLTAHPDFPNNPDFRKVIGGFESRLAYPDDSREGYGARMSGLFIPPSSGDWVFYLASDDASQLFLNPSGPNAAGKVKIQEETGCCNTYAVHKSASYPLTAGQGYYIEVLYKEGTGGDFARVYAGLAAEPTPAGGTPNPPASLSIPGGWMGYPAAPPGIGGALVITQQPTSQSVNANSSVTFATVATNSNGLSIYYQWQRDNGTGFEDIAGANNSSYTIALALETDSGAKFRAKACVIGTNTLSGEATLTVSQDTTPPQCVSASGTFNLSNIVVRFSEKVTLTSAQDLFNYTIAGRAVVVAILQADGRSVLLQVDPALTPDNSYQVTIQNVADLADNVISPNPCTLSFRSFSISCGFALQELYFGIGGGTAVNDLRAAAKYPNSPDLVRYKGETQLNTVDEFDNYGARISGFLLPPVSGNYNFYMSSDDGGELWLSTDNNPGNKVQIASEPVWNGRRDWVGTTRRNAAAPENRSTTLFPSGIPLVAGQMYYFEALFKEGGGGDNLQFTWQLPGAPEPANGSAPIGGLNVAALADPTGAMLQITQQPADLTVAAGATASFTVGITASRPGETNPASAYQWYRDDGSGFAAIAGANSATYSFASAQADNNARFQAQVYILGATATSSVARLTISGGGGVPDIVWMVGKDDNGWPAGDGGGPNASFVQENGVITPLPGSPTSTEGPQGADNDYYFAGSYTTAISSVTASYGTNYTPVGAVGVNEEAAERAFAAADNDLRYHFNLPAALKGTDQLSVSWDALNLDDPNAVNTDPRYGIEVYFNGVLVQTQMVIRPAQLNMTFTTPKFTAASVNAQVGPGFDNIVSLKGINYNAEGGGNWMGIDYVQLNFAAGVEPPTGLITSVVETGGDNEPTDTITAKWTGQTFPVSVDNEPVPGAVIGNNYTVGVFGNHAPSYVDRNHRYTNASDTVAIPAYLVGGEYLMSGNDNRDNASYVLDVTVSAPVTAYLLIDNRLGDAGNTNPPTFDATHMQWVLDQGWTPVVTGANHLGNPAGPDEVGIDEGADGTLNNWFSVYRKDFPAGTFQLRQADNAGQNMYGAVVTAQAAPPGPVYTFNDCQTPAGVTLSGVARVADDGTGTNCVLHLTDDGQCNPGINGDAVFPVTESSLLDMQWRSRIGGTGQVCTDGAAQAMQNGPGADGYSVSWGTDVATSGVGEEGTGTGLIVAVDTFNNAEIETPDVAIDISYNGQRLAFDGISSDPQAAKDFLRKNEFVDARLQVTSSGQATFTYDGRIVTAQLPNWTGIADGNIVFGARTGGAADNHWIDDLQIKTFTAGPINITRQPQNVTVRQEFTATFSVNVDGTPPYTFQWLANGSAIPGATSSTYTTPPAAPSDNGTVFVVTVANSFGSVTSAPAVLTVLTDTNAPTCLSASGLSDPSSILITFSEEMTTGPAQDIFNYSFPGGNITGATLQADGKSVRLRLDTPLALDTSYQVTIQNVTDLAGNVISPNPCTLSFRSFTISCGFVLKELYLNIGGGTAISDLRGSSKYPGSPDLVRYGDVLELNTFDEFENYGARLSGWLIPPVSGNYNFYMSSDDAGEFWLSTDNSPANLVQVASEPTWNGRRDWTGTTRRNAAAPENRSTTLFPAGIPLTAGQMYYFEALVKEGGGGDNLAVAWQLPGAPVPLNGSTPIPGAFMAALANPVGATLQITQQPTDQTVPAGPASFSVGVTASTTGNTNPPVFYQWYRDSGTGFASIAGANSNTYSFVALASDNGARFRAQVYIPGATATSSVATLTVTGTGTPNTPPQFTCGPNQTVDDGAGAQTVPNWATGILAYTSPQILYASDFSSLPAGGELGGNAAVTGGILHLTDALNSQQGSFATPSVPEAIGSLTASFKALVGGGTCCGDRTADGWSFNYGAIPVPVTFPVAAEEFAGGSSLTVAFDSWDNAGTDEAPAVDVKINGTTIAFQSFDGVREGGRAPAGPLITDPATGMPMTYKTGTSFTDVRINLDPDGTLDLDFKGVRIFDNLQTGLAPIAGARIAFGARTGGANDNHWIDDLNIVAAGAAPPGEANQTVSFIVSNDNPSLFSAQPAVSPNGTLTYTPAVGHCGVAHVTVLAQDSGGTANGGDDTSDPCTFEIAVTGCSTNQCPLANPLSLTVAPNGSVNFQLPASDPESDPLQYTITQAPAHGIVVLQMQTGAGTYTPTPGYTGPDSFSYRVNDGQCDSAPALVSITVGGVVNHNPTAVISASPLFDFTPSVVNQVAISCNGSNACLVLDGSGSSDPDGDPLTFNWFLQPSPLPFATGAQVNQCLELGEHTIELAVSDGRGGVDTATLTIEVLTFDEGLSTLIEKVNSSNIVRKNKRPFIATLKAAAASAERGQLHTTANQLKAFQNKVRAQVSRSNPSDAACWILWAQNIIDAIEFCE